MYLYGIESKAKLHLFTMRKFLFFAVGLLIAVQTYAQLDSRPNIVLILVDDMGGSDIGSYGSEIATPHLDRLTDQGMRFTQFYNTAKCFTSRACLLTGLYAHQAGVKSMPYPGKML